MKRFRSLALAALAILSLAGGLPVSAPIAHAQTNGGVAEGLNAVANQTGLTMEDPRRIAARIINIFLSVLGVVFFVLILYAGFLWMTSGGSEEQVGRAKTMMRNAIIGLIIILMSYALTTFVINALIGATTGGGGGVSGGGGGGGGPGLPGGGGSTSFQMQSITPSGSVPIRNIQVNFLFSRDVDAASASSSIHVVKASDSSEVAGTVSVAGSVVTFTPAATCPAPNTDRHCFDPDTDYVARVATSLRSTGGLSLVCGGFAPACQGAFHSGTAIDTQPPTVAITSPFDGQSVSADDVVHVQSHATDDAGVSYVETDVEGTSIGNRAASGTQTRFDTTIDWDTTGLATGPKQLQSTAHDIDSNQAQSSVVTVQVRPRTCFDGTRDGDETGIDCGGSCGACSGGPCTSGAMCASGVCSAGVCVEQPVITAVTPDDGRPGTLVSIQGVNFGTNPGTVTFSSGVTASAPAACAGSGSPTWTPTLVLVTVPAGAVRGPITLQNSAGLSDATNDTRGPAIDDFNVNTSSHPGLCAAVPNAGVAGDRIELRGAGLGTSSDQVYFNDRLITSFQSWTDSAITLNAPVYSPATYAVTAHVGGVSSNAVAFSLNAPTTTAGPIIDAVSPGSGPIGEYVTLQGRHFGNAVGRVVFKLGDGSGNADTNFPAECATAFWTDTSVTVKVPATYHVGLGDTPVSAGAWNIELQRQDGANSNDIGFTVASGSAHPGICAIRPTAGPVGTNVEIIGERFGNGATGQANFSAPSGAHVPMTVAASDWTDTSVKGRVPTGSQTGPVNISQGSVQSNSVNFAVRNCNEDASICTGGETCCRNGACSVGGVCEPSVPNAEFAWNVSTGILPINPSVIEECSPTRPASPSPWAGRTGGDRACVNTDIFIRFTTPLDPSTVTVSGATPSLVVRKCTGPADSPCSTAGDPIAPASGYPIVGTDGDPSTGTGYVMFRPGAMWDGNATYQVILTTAIQSATHVPMLERTACGAGNGYCFTFGTRAATDTCRIGTVNNVPATADLASLGQTVGLSAVPRAADDICLNLRADAYDWTWHAGDSRVDVTNNTQARADGTLRGLENQTATGRAETGSTPTIVNSSVTQGAETITGRSDVYVRLQPPRVTSFGPNCDQACLNAAAWAQFNVPMDPTTAMPSNVRLQRCVNENCISFDGELNLADAVVHLTSSPGAASSTNTYFILEPTARAPGGGVVTLLEVGRFYRITLLAGTSSGFRSAEGLPLVGLNSPDGFSWTFRVREGDNARCSVANVNVTPGEKYETAVGNRQMFTATPVSAPDACSSAGSPLVSDRTYAWTIDQTSNVSRYVNGGTGSTVGAGLIDTGAPLPAGCSDRCTPVGAGGVVGHVASCGNGIVETTDSRYCHAGHTPFGDPCTLLPPGSKGGEECDDASSQCDQNTCLWKPMVGGTCGNGHVDRGEQCDEGPNGGPGCSSTCQLLGARAGGSTCGNDDVAEGEACDDGNTQNGDGCSSDCLHEGSSRIVAVCGNGRLEPGETCERPAPGAPFPPGCDPVTCLHTGTNAPTCGNGVIDPGEDCDDGNVLNGDGCSSHCLAEGSSASYAVPSFCGDGTLGRGELCEAATPGGGRPDAAQLAEIVGEGTPDASGRLSSSIHTTYDSKDGLATYGLQCGYTQESSCPSGTGLDNAGCCAPRPSVLSQSPSAGSVSVCRNALISGTFNVKMDEGSVQANFVIASDLSGTTCPAGTTLLGRIEDFDNSPGLAGFFHRLWLRFLAWVTPHPAEAALCVGSVTGHLSFIPAGDGTTASFTLDHALDANTHYQVLFRGDTNLVDNSNIANRLGVKSQRGVVADGNFLWDFTTGNRVCTVTAISVRDTNADSPNLFTHAAESHLYSAQVIALSASGTAISLSPVAEYGWTWQPWVASNPDALVADTGTALGSESTSTLQVATPPKNGSSFVEAGIEITEDDVNVPSTTGRIITGTQPAQVLLCENPWPDRGHAPFAEVAGNASLSLLAPSPSTTQIQTVGPYFNFSTLYCRDAGEPGVTDDLPAMNIQPVPVSNADAVIGILRQYLLTFDVPSLKSDGVGIRVATNPLHLTPAAWYASRGFRGKPDATTIDGYEAVKDGTTWYVGAVNTADATGAPVYSQIYIVSFNPDAKPETINIANQLVANFALNANIQGGASNACEYAVPDGSHSAGELYRGTSGQLVRCTADWECVANNPNLSCASFKAKMQRDSKRIVDFQFMSTSLEDAKGRTGSYPKLNSGSFIPTLSTSRWPSWSQELQSETGVQFPSDPVNRFLTCGACSDNGAPCQDTSECNQGATCQPPATDAHVEPSTCWNSTASRYICPRLNPAVPESASRLYQYRAVNGGDRYELSTELEGANYTRYVPPLLSEIKHCSNVDSACRFDTDCDVHLGAVITHGTCNGTGGIWRYAGVCDSSTVYGSGGGVCGDGVISSTELCELGDTNPVACTTASGAAGTKLQICNDCHGWIDGPATTCVANVACGNGRVDAGESCDDGALNGTYGHCNRTCSGYDAFCGDGRLSPGEHCDNGGDNGSYCRSSCDSATSCNLSCSGPGPRCGDGHVDEGFEDCDGNSQQTPSAICVGGTNASNTCTTDADCPGSTCGTTPATASCAGVTARRCSNDRTEVCTSDADCGTALTGEPARRCITYPTARTRACNDYGSTAPTTQWCRWNSWGSCQPVGYCGDGHVDPGEECDDGNTNNNDSCTNACKRNVCGDGVLQTGVEECDLGALNGTRSCTADYGSTCLSCSTTCRQVASSGGYCGNGVKEGSEQCDGNQGLGSCSGDSTRSCTVDGDCASGQTCNLVSCRALGYDYAQNIKCPTQARCVGSDGHCSGDSTHSCTANSDCGGGQVCNFPLLAVYPPIDFTLGDPEGTCTGHETNGAFYPASPTPTEIPITQIAACQPGAPIKDVLSCAAACSITGCGRCSDATGNGFIAAQVFDAIYANQPVPNARVTLYNNGVQVSQTYTDKDGNFVFNNLSTLPQCNNYRIVVDFYTDNPCTGSTGRPANGCNNQTWPTGLAAPDESIHGGYWPFTSNTFNAGSFTTAGIGDSNGHIFLAPRVGPGETLVVTTWNGSLPRYMDAHVLLPDLEWNPPTSTNYNIPGDPNLDAAPHAYLACYHNDGTVGCGSYDTAPETMLFKRGPWALSGRYAFYLVDWSPDGVLPSYRYFDSVSTTVRIITEDRVYTVKPPNTMPTLTTCSAITPSNRGKYWLVFTEDAASGGVQVPGASDQGMLMCGPSPAYGTPTGTSTRALLDNPSGWSTVGSE
jgi:cysteine-rich repeat protein